MNPTDSDNPNDYTWQDTKGEDGTPGLPGEDGRTPYLHIKYSDNGGLSFTANNGEEPGAYIGQYTDFEQKDSDNPNDYTWAQIKGEPGNGGTDAGAGEYYEYRYAKNGSTVTPPALDVNSSNPTGWSKEMPTVSGFEYVWCTIAKKSGLSDRTKINIPVSDTDKSNLADISGNGYNAKLDTGAKVVSDGSRYAVDLSGGIDGIIPYDLPFGESFTLCFWMKSNQGVLKWMLNGYNGRQYVEKSISITPNTWFHLTFRFNGSSVAVFKDGSFVHNGNVGEAAVGFALYDDEVFGSSVLYDDIRLLDYALPDNDIASVMNGKADELIQKWSTPIRVNPYDGQDGKPGTSVTLADVEYAQSSSNTTAPTTGWSTTAPAWVDGKYIWSRTKITYSDNTTSYTKAACITGGKGSTGGAGVGVKSIEEQYYLSSSANSLLNGSWSTNRPAWKDKWYIWTRSIITYTNGTSTTTAAICVTGSKGDKGEPGVQGEKGENPVAVFVGVYSANKTYTGNKYRLDVVKYNGVFYVARIDAGSFSGIVPTNTSKWNPFGAQFESIATNLLLAEGANIGDWYMAGGKIVSTLQNSSNKITMDAKNARFEIESSQSGGDYSQNMNQGSKIRIDAYSGIIEARSKSNTGRVAYMSPTGIFCNNAETQAVSATLGVTHKAAIVGLGFGNVNKYDWSNENFLAGVYGIASNSGTAPGYGGFFQNLMAAGLFLNTKTIGEGSGNTYLSESASMVIGYSRYGENVYLPSDGVIGRTIFFKQWWTGFMRIAPRGGQKLYDDHAENAYIDVGEGWAAICEFTIGYVNGVKKEAWLISKFRW